jgi:Arc/MetJ family transcription regulator
MARRWARVTKGPFLVELFPIFFHPLAMCELLCDVLHMATNVEIDPELIQDALALGGKHTKREVIEEALREYVLRRKQQGVLKLFGTVEYDSRYDYKRQRARR